MPQTANPHAGLPVLTAGAPLPKATAAMVLVHGRGATAESILSLVDHFDRPGLAYLAPQAADNTWYPFSFLAPPAQNEPWLYSALAVLADLFTRLAQEGLPPDRTVLLGFRRGRVWPWSLPPKTPGAMAAWWG